MLQVSGGHRALATRHGAGQRRSPIA